MSWVEIVGIIGAAIVLVSMCFKTTSFKAALWLRVVNLIGCAVFVVYGALIPAIATAVLNGGLVIVNAIHIFLLFRDKNKEQK